MVTLCSPSKACSKLSWFTGREEQRVNVRLAKGRKEGRRCQVCLSLIKGKEGDSSGSPSRRVHHLCKWGVVHSSGTAAPKCT